MPAARTRGNLNPFWMSGLTYSVKEESALDELSNIEEIIVDIHDTLCGYLLLLLLALKTKLAVRCQSRDCKHVSHQSANCKQNGRVSQNRQTKMTRLKLAALYLLCELESFL